MTWPFLQNSQILVSSLCGIVTFYLHGWDPPMGGQFARPLLGVCELVHIWPFALVAWRRSHRTSGRKSLALLLQRNNNHAEAAEYWRRYLANDAQSVVREELGFRPI